MSKKEVQKRVLQNGKPLSLSLFSWDEKTKTFTSKEAYLVIDFSGINDVTFNAGYGCTIRSWSNCNFKTSASCVFDTGFSCSFDSGNDSIVVRRDTSEVIELKEGEEIKTCGYLVRGYDVINSEPKTLMKIDDGENITIAKLKELAKNPIGQVIFGDGPFFGCEFVIVDVTKEGVLVRELHNYFCFRTLKSEAFRVEDTTLCSFCNKEEWKKRCRRSWNYIAEKYPAINN